MSCSTPTAESLPGSRVGSVLQFSTEETRILTSAKSVQVIEVFADIWCPFTHIGLKLVAGQLRKRGRQDVTIWVRSWPLEWVNGQPMDPSATLDHINEIRVQVSTEVFVGFQASRFPHSTIPVLALVAHAYRADRELGQVLSLEVRDRLFERGLDVSDRDTLVAMAKSFGLDPPDPDDYGTVVSDWKEGRRRGVAGSPHFFCAGMSVFCPSLDISESAQSEGRTIHTNISRLQGFLDGCLSREVQNTAEATMREGGDYSE
jgi:predicted DsbA family dithiol-disulfide isomerase